MSFNALQVEKLHSETKTLPNLRQIVLVLFNASPDAFSSHLTSLTPFNASLYAGIYTVN